MKYTYKRGFTLVEMLFIIAIIGIITGITFASVGTARSRARDAQRLTDIGLIKIAIQNYYAKRGVYPSLPGNFYVTNGSTGHSWAEFEAELGVKLPLPPNPGVNSYYEYYKSWGYGSPGAGNCYGKAIIRVLGFENKAKVSECNEQYDSGVSTYLLP